MNYESVDLKIKYILSVDNLLVLLQTTEMHCPRLDKCEKLWRTIGAFFFCFSLSPTCVLVFALAFLAQNDLFLPLFSTELHSVKRRNEQRQTKIISTTNLLRLIKIKIQIFSFGSHSSNSTYAPRVKEIDFQNSFANLVEEFCWNRCLRHVEDHGFAVCIYVQVEHRVQDVFDTKI